MRWLVDGRPLLVARGGIHRFIRETLVAMAEADDDEIVLATHAPSGLGWPRARVSERVLRVPQRGRTLEAAFRNAALPWLARRVRADALLQPSFAAPWRVPCPVVVTVPALAFERMPELVPPRRQRETSRLTRRAVARAARVLAISQSTADDLESLYHVSRERIRVVPLGVSDHFRPVDDPGVLERLRQRLRLPARFVLFTGTLEPRKNVPTLIDAYAQLVAKYDVPQDLVLAGRADRDLGAIERRIAEHGLERRIHRVGFVRDEDLPLLYAAAEAFALPSLYEGFGIPVLEALACGTPVVTSNVSSLPEAGGDAAALVDPRDPVAMADALAEALEPGSDRDERRRAGVRHARRFRWESVARETAAVLREAACA